MYNTAVFIDGDNIHINNLKFNLLFDDIADKNNVIIRRVYGDWKLECMNNFWDKHILDNGLEEIQISRLCGKNSTDNKIIVDVMDLISNMKNIHKIILIGCDKDYIPLIRYAIQYNYIFEVYGLRQQTSISIINACTYYYDINEYLEKMENNTEYYDKPNIIHKSKEYKEEEYEEEEYDEVFILLNELVSKNGILISELKRKIRNLEKKSLFGKEYRTLNLFIKNNYGKYFDVKIKKGRVMIYNLNNLKY